MNDKNGYTLIELLAVIAILGILLMVVAPKLVKTYKDTKDNTFVEEVQSIMKGVTKQYMPD